MIWDISREIVGYGSVVLRWYSLLFALGIVIGFFITQHIFRKEDQPLELLDSLLFHVVIGTVVGARLGHCLFYEPDVYLRDPVRILKIWEGGLASHGGFTGVMVALLVFCRQHRQLSFFWLADRMAIAAMAAAACIRLGNFFNSEIYGKATLGPWAVVFKKVDLIPRHPTQLYEAAGYTVIAAVMYLAYLFTREDPREGRLFGLVLVLGYGFRFAIEPLKENQVPFEAVLPLNMGQLLSLPFIAGGCALLAGLHYHSSWLRRGLSKQALAAAGFASEDSLATEVGMGPLEPGLPPGQRGPKSRRHGRN